MNIREGRRPLTADEIDEAGLNDFLALCKQRVGSAARWTDPNTPIATVILKGRSEDDQGAWACSKEWLKSAQHEIWITEGYAQALKYHSAESSAHLLRVLRTMSRDNPLVKLWGNLPVTEEAADTFGRLVSTAASTFIIEHELAHIMLGHIVHPPADFQDSLVSHAKAVRVREVQPAAAIDEVGAAAAFNELNAATSDALWSQMREVDADTHALVWTRHHMAQLGEKGPSSQHDSSTLEQGVIDAFLSPGPGLRYLTVVGAVLSLLLVDARRIRGPLVKGTHPPTAARVVMLVKAEAALSPEGGEQLQTDAFWFAASLLATLAAAGWQKAGLLPPLREDFDREARQQYVYDQVLELSGIKAAISNYDGIATHYTKLALVRRSVTAYFQMRAPLKADDVVNWFGRGGG